MKIVVSPNPYRDKQFKNARQACSILREAGAEVALCLPFDVDKTFEIPHDLRFQDIQKEIKTADMLICFGGDGTILHSSKIATEHNLPILGVNIGTMGFIAELEAGEIELLRKIPKGDYTVEERTMLDVSVGNGRQTLFHETALNDAVITKGAIARVVQLGIYCDGIEATSYSGDGVILCTPTGSTAYSLSVGGPVVAPQCACLVLSPVAPHNLTMRPVVIPSSSDVRLKVHARHAEISIATDNETCPIPEGAEFRVRLASRRFFLAVPHNISFYDTLRDKMMWGVDIRD